MFDAASFKFQWIITWSVICSLLDDLSSEVSIFICLVDMSPLFSKFTLVVLLNVFFVHSLMYFCRFWPDVRFSTLLSLVYIFRMVYMLEVVLFGSDSSCRGRNPAPNCCILLFPY